MLATSRVDGCPYGILPGSVIMPDLKDCFLLQHVTKMTNGHSLTVTRVEAKIRSLRIGILAGGSTRPSLERQRDLPL